VRRCMKASLERQEIHDVGVRCIAGEIVVDESY
jgi:hypothetical protein